MRRRSFLPETLGLAAFFGFALPLAANQTLSHDTAGAAPGAFDQDGPDVALYEAPSFDGVDRGAPILEPRSDARRPVPLPRRARWIAGEHGDELVEEASGDPYFVGFVGAILRPQGTERVDGALVERLIRGATDARPEPVTYAYAILDAAASPRLAAELEAAGARVLGFRPHNAFALAVDHESLARVQALDFVRWIGVARDGHKMHPRLADAFEGVQPGERGAVVVSVFETDLHAGSAVERIAPTEVAGPGGVRETHAPEGARWRSEGWQQRAIEGVGAEVVEYLPSIHAFRIRATATELARIIASDFVEFVEADLPSYAMHDDSQPMIGTDYTRATYDGNWSGEAVGGEIDSGIDVSHTGLDHAWYLGWTFTGQSAWSDSCPHGTHVAGTILARPHAALAELAGAVPALATKQTRSFRSVKFMEQNPNPGNNCIGVGGSSLESRFSLMRSDWTNGQFTSLRPHFVNNSWGTGAAAGGWVGSEANSRAVDAEVWNHDQVYVFAAGNQGPAASTLSQEASAKNAVSVGNVLPYNSGGVGLPATLWTSSSVGPTGDSRWKPNVVAPGRRIVSTDAHTGNGYAQATGTSMAAPHVSGVIAQMVDRNAFLRYAPARVASLLMATAHTKGGVTLSSPSATHLSQYGAGRVDALRAVQTDGQHTWNNWGFTLAANENAIGDFTIQEGAQRLVVVMHYIEPASSAGASKALVNDFDLVLDAAPFAAAIDQGDFLAHQSDVDNTEIRSLNNPQVGAWRWKIHPVSATTSVRMSVTVHVIYATPLPNPTLGLAANKAFAKPDEAVTITATVTNPSHVASAVHLDTTNTTNATLDASTMVLKDGLVADLTDNPQNSAGLDPTLGNIRHGTNRQVRWDARWASQGIKTWNVNGTSDNGMNRTAQVQVIVDGTPPAAATNLTSPSHFTNTWYAANDVHLVWNHASDNLAGVAGYSRSITTSPSFPPAVMHLGETTSTFTGPLATNASGWYFNLRAVDKAGNWSQTWATSGPYLVDNVAPGIATQLGSSSHEPGVWSNVPVIDVHWNAAHDAHSGIGGYASAWNTIPIAPGQTKNLDAVTTAQSPVYGSSNSSRWFSLRAVDAVGNWSGAFASIGPFRIDVTPPSIADVSVWNEVAPMTETSSPGIFVVIDASDAHSGLGSVRLKNDEGAWSPWMGFTSVVQWDLFAHGGSHKTGYRRIEVQVRDVAGNVSNGATNVYYWRPHWYFGAPGIGAAGAPEIDAEGIFGKGKQAIVRVTNTTAPWRRLVLGTSNTTWNGLPLPLDLGLVGAPGNSLLVSPDITLYEGIGDEVALSIPPHIGTAGSVLHLQWLLFGDPSGATIVTTRGVSFELNGL